MSTLTKTFFEAFSAKIDDAEILHKGGLSYLAAAAAVRMAGFPEVTFVDFDGKPYLDCLGGALVAVDLAVPGTDVIQRTWLPVMDRDNMTLALDKTQLTDINNNRQRCLVKAIAAVYGDGMSIFLGCDGDGEKAAKMLGVNPDSELTEVPPVIATLKEGGAPFIEWGIGLAACRITDPTFHWEVVLWPDAQGRMLPYREVLGGLMVDVDTVYRGKRQRLSLPVMDAAFKQMPVARASVFDWNKTVMRALTKCIAFNAGYGIGVYADEFGIERDTGKAKRTGKSSSPKAAEAQAPVAEANAPVAEATVAADAQAPVTDADSPAEVIAANAESDNAIAEVAAQGDATPVAEAATAVEASSDAEAAPAAEASPDAEAAPAAEQTAVAESAPAADAAATADTAPVASGDFAEAIQRFRGVMQSRREAKGVEGLISLYKALHESTKYTAEEKPACFAVLTPAIAVIITEEHIEQLLTEIEKYEAMKYLAQDARSMVAAKLSAVHLRNACDKGNNVLLHAPTQLMTAGVAAHFDDVLLLAKAGGLDEETLALLDDLVEQEIAAATA